jgi:hypothetical protein
MRCERCRAEATSTGPRGQRLCDTHYNPNLAAAPALGSTGTGADAFGALILADAVAGATHGGHVPVIWRRRRVWQRMRRRLTR